MANCAGQLPHRCWTGRRHHRDGTHRIAHLCGNATAPPPCRRPPSQQHLPVYPGRYTSSNATVVEAPDTWQPTAALPFRPWTCPPCSRSRGHGVYGQPWSQQARSACGEPRETCMAWLARVWMDGDWAPGRVTRLVCAAPQAVYRPVPAGVCGSPVRRFPPTTRLHLQV